MDKCDHAYVIGNNETGWLHCMFCHYPMHKTDKKTAWEEGIMMYIWSKDPEYFKQQ